MKKKIKILSAPRVQEPSFNKRKADKEYFQIRHLNKR